MESIQWNNKFVFIGRCSVATSKGRRQTFLPAVRILRMGFGNAVGTSDGGAQAGNSAWVFLDPAMAPAYPKPIKPAAASLSTFPECFFLKINYPALRSLAFVSASNCCIKDLAGEALPVGFPKGRCLEFELDPPGEWTHHYHYR